jgi:hypothetical protein
MAPLPDVRCPLASATRGSHEWAPRPSGSFYCTACLANLTATDVDDWKLLLEIEMQRGQTALSGEAYQVFSSIAADAVALSPSERRLLLRLAAEPAYVIPHDDLGEALWGPELSHAHDRAALRQQVTALRRKLSRLRLGVTAVPGIGYRLTATCAGRDK